MARLESETSSTNAETEARRRAIEQRLAKLQGPTPDAGASYLSSAQSPDAVSRNNTTSFGNQERQDAPANNPAPDGFHWEGGRIVQNAGTDTRGPSPFGTGTGIYGQTPNTPNASPEDVRNRQLPTLTPLGEQGRDVFGAVAPFLLPAPPVGGLISKLPGVSKVADAVGGLGSSILERLGGSGKTVAGDGFKLVGDATSTAETGAAQAARAAKLAAREGGSATDAAALAALRDAATKSVSGATDVATGGLGSAITRRLAGLPTSVKTGAGIAGVAGAVGAAGQLANDPSAAATALPDQTITGGTSTPITDTALTQQAADRAAQLKAAQDAAAASDATQAADRAAQDEAARRGTTTTTNTTTNPTVDPNAGTTDPNAGATGTAIDQAQLKAAQDAAAASDAAQAAARAKQLAGKTVGGKLPGTTGAGGKVGNQLPGSGGSGGSMDSSQLQASITSDLGQISQILAAGPQTPDVQAIFSVQSKSLIDMLDKQIAEMQAQGANDPATQNVLQTLRDELDRQLKATTEELNRRGLLDSGILVQAQTDLRKGSMSDQAKVLGEALSRLQTNIQSLRSQKFSTQSQFALAGAQGQTQADAAERARLDQLRGQGLNTKMGLLSNATGVEQAQAGRDFSAGQAQLGRDFSASQNASSQNFTASQNASQQDFTAQQNDLQRRFAMVQAFSAQAAASGNAEAKANYDAQADELSRQFDQVMQNQRIDAGQYSNSGDAASGAAATQHIIDQAMYAPSLEEALAALDDQAAELEASGVNLSKAEAAIIRAWQGAGGAGQ